MMPDAQRVRFSVLDFWGNREVREGPLACAPIGTSALLHECCPAAQPRKRSVVGSPCFWHQAEPVASLLG
jgi:hypothetical protein